MTQTGDGSSLSSENMRNSRLNDYTRLLRQIPRSWVKEGHVTSQAFRPTEKDKGRISVYDGDRINPRDAWKHFTTALGFQSVGVVAVTVVECTERSLSVYDDPLPGFKEHVLVDFRMRTSALSLGRIAKDLRVAANLRGWLFREPDEPNKA